MWSTNGNKLKGIKIVRISSNLLTETPLEGESFVIDVIKVDSEDIGNVIPKGFDERAFTINDISPRFADRVTISTVRKGFLFGRRFDC